METRAAELLARAKRPVILAGPGVLWDRDILAFFLIGTLLFGMGIIGSCLVELCLRGRLDAELRETTEGEPPQAVVWVTDSNPVGEPALDVTRRGGGVAGEDVAEVAVVEFAPKQEGRNMTMVLGPVKAKGKGKKKIAGES